MNWEDKQGYFENNENVHSAKNPLQDTLLYIEEHLSDTLAVETLADKAAYSIYHFQRLFSVTVGIPVSEYIRCRRLSLAAFQIQHTKKTLLEIAFEFQYQTPASFSRAFKQFHGVSPKEAKEKGRLLKMYPSAILKKQKKGESEMKYRLAHMETLEVFGVETIIKNEETEKAVPAFWSESRASGAIDCIKQLAGVSLETPLHAVLYDCSDKQYCYMICLPVKGEEVNEFTRLIIPKGEYAVFSTGVLSYQEMSVKAAELWREIFIEWFPVSEYQLAEAPEIEFHYLKENNRYEGEIWIPVTKK